MWNRIRWSYSDDAKLWITNYTIIDWLILWSWMAWEQYRRTLPNLFCYIGYHIYNIIEIISHYFSPLVLLQSVTEIPSWLEFTLDFVTKINFIGCFDFGESSFLDNVITLRSFTVLSRYLENHHVINNKNILLWHETHNYR